MSRKRYTDDEIQHIITCVENNPTNLAMAFRQAAQDLNRPFSSVSLTWYRRVKRENDVFVIKTKTKTIANTKTVRTAKISLVKLIEKYQQLSKEIKELKKEIKKALD